ncbi:MAG: homoserine kinase [Pseudomonadales bacterium]
MAVYTVLDRENIEHFIEPFGIGPLIDFEGVAAGIENTNYFVSTDPSDFPNELQTEPTRHFVLTLFEAIDTQELDFFVALTTLLNLHGLPVPCPLTDANGAAIQSLQGKPALLIPKLGGEHPDQPSQEQCQAIGQALGNVHKVCVESGLQHSSSRGFGWLENCAADLRPQLVGVEQTLLDEIPRFLQQVAKHPDLPQAVIHGDLFRDNTLFEGNTLIGLIDFNSAGSGYLMYDLAVIINDWCSKTDGSLNQQLTATLVAAYQQVRPFSNDEALLWNDFLRIAATRFWISRLTMQLQPQASHRPGGLVELKDPQQYKNILLQRIHNPQPLHK